jgi:hypothetical protein
LGFEFEVMEADPRRIRRLRIRPRARLVDGLEAQTPEPDEAAELPIDVQSEAPAPVKSMFLPDDRLPDDRPADGGSADERHADQWPAIEPLEAERVDATRVDAGRLAGQD